MQENVLIGSLASMPPLGTSGGSTHPTLLAPPPPARATVAETGLQLPDAVTAPGPPRFAPPSAPPPSPAAAAVPEASLFLPPPSSCCRHFPPPSPGPKSPPPWTIRA